MKTEIRRAWYNRTDVQQQIMPFLMARETCFLMPFGLREKNSYPIRCIKAHHSSYLLNNMKAFSFFERPYNLYHSIFMLYGMPMFTYHPMKRSQQQQEFFKDYDSYIINADYVVDFDGEYADPEKCVQQAHEACLEFCKVLDAASVKYAVIFSGSKGFHVEVRGLKEAKGTAGRERVEMFKQLTLAIARKCNVKVKMNKDDNGVIDGTIYSVTRIWKCPYSYDTKTDMIVYPLTREQLQNFKREDYTAEKIMQGNIYNRGLCERQGDPNNIFKLAEELGVYDGKR